MPLLDIRNLTIEFMTAEGPVKAVDRVSMTLTEGEVRGLVGESGSGKSLIAKAICGVTKDNWRVTADRFRFDDIDLLQLSPRERRRLVGHNVSMIFQEPQSCLDPSESIGRQLAQAIPGWTYKGRWWQRFNWRKRRAIELLHRVGIKDHDDIMGSFPYELTEGECQKVMIAIALANQPRLLIADEPTNAMEPTTQAQIFRLLARLNQNNNTTILLISHDLQMMSKWADRVNVLYCGQTVESAQCEELLAARRAGGGAHHRSGAPDAHQHRRCAEPKLHQGRRYPRPVALHYHSPPRVAQCAAANCAQAGAAVLHHAHAGNDHRSGVQLAGPRPVADQRHSPAGLCGDFRRRHGGRHAGDHH